MSTSIRSDRGPIIQKQGFVKRAPSGKLSAFKKWEKKWCVFALSNKNGPVMDLFEDRMTVEKGPTSALARYELKHTKQVCHAIECKVPYSFIIVTENRIISLAALSQPDANSWVQSLRRVLEREGAIKSEDHTYEISGANLVTRQEQERQARSRRPPPPTPPGSDSESDATRSGIPEAAPPLPPSRSDHQSPTTPPKGQAPALPKRGIPSIRGVKPPPIPNSERPPSRRPLSASKSTAPGLSSKSSPPEGEAQRNLQAVLDNYQDSPDTTYEYGDRQVIAAAAARNATLNHNQLTDALDRWKESEGHHDAGTKSSTLTAGTVPPLYSKIDKERGKRKTSAAATNHSYDSRPELPEKKRNQRPVAAARRPAPRVEHDFSPTLPTPQNIDSDTDSSSDGEGTLGRDAPPLPPNHAGDVLSSEDEDTYACMDGFADSVIGSESVRNSMLDSANWGSDEDGEDDRYVETPFTRQSNAESRHTEQDTPIATPAASAATPAAKPLTPPMSPQPIIVTSPSPPTLSNQPKPKPSTAIDQSAIDYNIYENSKTVKDEGKVKAMPTAAPRRAKTVNAVPPAVSRLKASAHPVPMRRESVGSIIHNQDNSENEQDDYENSLGLFGTGVTPDRKSKPENHSNTLPPKLSSGSTPLSNVKRATKSVKLHSSRSPPISRLKAAQSFASDADMPPLPPLPTPPNNNHPPKTSAAGKSTEKTNNKQTVLISSSDIPLADGESSDDISSQESNRNSNQISSNQAPAPAPASMDEDLRIRLDAVSSSLANPNLPDDEAPPPYTPPRLLTDSRKSNNMDLIAEGDSEEEEVIDIGDNNNKTKEPDNVISVVTSKPVRTIEEPLYDSHMAFMRPSVAETAPTEQEYDSHAAFIRPPADKTSPTHLKDDLPPILNLKPSVEQQITHNQLEYDTHAAFARRSDRTKFFNKRISMPVISLSADVPKDADIPARSKPLAPSSSSRSASFKTSVPPSSTISSTAEKKRKLSPHTPPGTPPPYARLLHYQPNSTGHTPLSSGNYNSPDEDVHIRLEDTFPKMPQRTPSTRKSLHGQYKEEVVLNSSLGGSTTSERNSKLSYRKSFSVLPSKERMANGGDKSSLSKPRASPRLSISTEELKIKNSSRPAQAEYDYLVKLRVQKANRALLNSQSSSSDDNQAPTITRRRPNRQTSAEKAARRKSAPPNSLAIKPVNNPPPVVKPRETAGKDSSKGTPSKDSSKGTPSREGSTRRAPNREASDSAAVSKDVAEPAPREAAYRERRHRRPLDGGTLMREGKIFKAPNRDKKNLPLKQAQTEMLQEEIAHSYGVNVTVWRKDVKYALFVDIMGSICVAGWNQKERPLLSNIFHLGDRILAVNNEPYTSVTKLMKLIKRSDSETKFEFVVRRLPFGKAYFVHRNLDYEDIGVILKPGSAEVVSVTKGGLVSRQGLRVNPNKAFGSGQCHWCITEVNHRPLNLTTSESEATARLNAVGKDVTFVVQPIDFIELLKRALKSTFGYKEYVVS